MPQIHCIALRTVHTTDRTSILTAWSRESGRISIALPAGDSREARRRRALTMPLAMFEGVTTSRKPREIITMRDVKPSCVNLSIASNPIKGSVAMFLADVLAHVLREAQTDESMWQFLSSSVATLEKISSPAALANFHIYFLVALTQMLGIHPDISTYSPGYVLDMANGMFVPTPPLHRHYLDNKDSALAASLLRINLRNMHLWRLSRQQRAQVLNTILDYYSLHHTGLSNLTSLQIVHNIFN